MSITTSATHAGDAAERGAIESPTPLAAAVASATATAAQPSAAARPGPPLWLLAELTYRCPLHCVFCYNPVDFATQEAELDTDAWLSVLRQARAMGSVQAGFSGGEPLLRDDLEVLVAEARKLGFYTNLLTSGIGFNAQRAQALFDAGLDHVQLSFQDSTRELNDFLSHTKTFEVKRRAARLVKEHGWPMVMNCVIHRANIDHIDAIIALADELGAEYLELANSQYYSWAMVNRDHLLPSRAQIEAAEATVARWRERLGTKMRILFVVPDYYEQRPKKCMNGWGSMFLTVTPDGTALPCHTAKMLPGLTFPNVRDEPIAQIWHDSDGFNRFRGTGWMKEPCASCPEKEKDLGGCRCQAYMLAQDAAAADPVCAKSPDRGAVDAALAKAERGDPPARPLVFRDPKSSRQLSALPAGWSPE